MLLALVIGMLMLADGPTTGASGDDPLAGYLDEDALGWRLRWHRERDFDKHAEAIGEPRVAMSCFVNGDPQEARLGLISEAGKFLSYLDVYQGSRRDRHLGEVVAADARRVAELLARLPASDKSPPLDDLFIVSFARGDRWETRTYRMSRLPEPVRELCRMAEMPPDSRKR